MVFGLEPTAWRVAIGTVALATACARQGGRAEPSASAEATVRQTVARITREFPERALAGDATGAAAWFARDAVLYVNGVPAVRGRDAIRVFYDQFFRAMPIRGMTFTTGEITMSGDLAVETGTTTLSIAAPGQTVPATVAGKYLAVWKRQPDGQWLLWRHAPSSNVMPTR
jgi:uncharacterized protein (TIGR02246 family)